MRRNCAWRSSASADWRCQLKSAVWRSIGMMPSIAGELDERIDAAIVEARGERAEGEADADLGAEPIAPAGLVLAQPRLAQIVVAQRGVERLGGELPADQAVVDAAAGRRLDQTGGVADREQARRRRSWRPGRAAGSSAAARASPAVGDVEARRAVAPAKERKSDPARASAISPSALERLAVARETARPTRSRAAPPRGRGAPRPARARRRRARAARSARTPAARRDRAAG